LQRRRSFSGRSVRLVASSRSDSGEEDVCGAVLRLRGPYREDGGKTVSAKRRQSLILAQSPREPDVGCQGHVTGKGRFGGPEIGFRLFTV
jgi:hypothetical protein